MRASLRTLALLALAVAVAPSRRSEERVVPNDNRSPAGVLRSGVLALHLEARVGMWYPSGDAEPGAPVPAFAEEGRAVQIPGPLVRVPAGTVLDATIRNALSHDTLVVQGLAARPVNPSDAPVRLAPGEVRALRFRLDVPGTYYYWGTTTGRDVTYRTGVDAQLSGAIIVDEVGAPPSRDRVLVMGMWSDTVARAFTDRRRILGVINGRTWPYTERLNYDIGDTVRLRVINASGDNHPMHLHGFYFRVDSRGDWRSDTTFRADVADRVVTQSMSPATTMSLTWVPDRAGNWMFHCHIPEHFGKRGPLGMEPVRSPVSSHTAMNHALEQMNGLVMGIQVRDKAGLAVARREEDAGRRHLRLLVRRNSGGSDDNPYFGFVLQEGAAAPPLDSGLHVGPPLVLVRGEPVSVTVVNTLSEPTAVHWHGIELESYYDGVAGFSGDAQRLSPIIAPRDSFIARFTPPRAGTFIYHTHVEEVRQQSAGLAGPLVVLEPGQQWDPSTDHTVMITSPWTLDEGRVSVLVNGSPAPAPLTLRAGVPHRFRFVNMTTRRPALRVELVRDTVHVSWREVAKDGGETPASRRALGPAIHQISIGETVDVEVTPAAPGDLRLEVRLSGVVPIDGRMPPRTLFATMPIHVVPGGSQR